MDTDEGNRSLKIVEDRHADILKLEQSIMVRKSIACSF